MFWFDNQQIQGSKGFSNFSWRLWFLRIAEKLQGAPSARWSRYLDPPALSVLLGGVVNRKHEGSHLEGSHHSIS